MSRTTRARAARAVAPVVGLLAAGLLVWQGSYAAFSATTSNTADVWTTGSMTLENNGPNVAGGFNATSTALFSATGLKIGDTDTKCITVRTGSTSTLGGSLRLYRGTVSGTGNTLLAPQVRLTIDAAPVTTAVPSACTGFPTTGVTNLHTGTGLDALPTTYAGATGVTMAAPAGSMVAYRISWTLQSRGTNALDNAIQGSTAQADLTWELQ